MLSDLHKPQVLYVILASDDPTNELDLSMQRKTWLQTISGDSRVVILRGHEKSSFIFDGETLRVPVPESYQNILEKTILGFSWILENIDFDLLIRTNVSTYYDTSRIKDVLRRFNLDSTQIGGFIELSSYGSTDDFNGEAFVTGTGIYLTKSSVFELISMDVGQFSGAPEDLSISRYLIGKGARMISLPRVNLHSTHFLLPGFQTRLKSSEISELASLRFQSLFSFYTESTFSRKALAFASGIKMEISHLHFDFFHLKFYLIRNYYIFRLNLNRLIGK
jgi:hypothetical protein